MATKAKQNRAPKPKARGQPPRRAAKPKPQKKNTTTGGTIALWSSHHTPTHVPRSLAHVPCTVVNERLVFTVNNNASYNTCGLIGPYMPLASGAETTQRNGITDMVAMYGVNLDVPSTGGTRIKSIQMAPYAGTTGDVSIRMNRLKVTFTNTGSGAAYPSGLAWIGTLDSTVSLTDFASCEALQNFLTGRRQMKSFTGFSLMDRTEGFVSYPLDPVDYNSFVPFTASGAAGQTLAEPLVPIAFVLPANAIISTYLVTVHIEWAVLFKNDGLLQSTHKHQSSHGDEVVRRAIAHASQSAGYLGTMEHDISKAGKAVLAAARSPLGRVARSVI